MQKSIQKFFASFFILQIIFPGWTQALAETTNNSLPYEENTVIVQYKKNSINIQNDTNLLELKNSLNIEDKTITEIIPEKNIALIEKKPNFLENVFRSVNGFSAQESTMDMIQHYKNDPNVEFVQPNFLYKINDTISETEISEKIVTNIENNENSNISEENTENSSQANEDNSETILENSDNNTDSLTSEESNIKKTETSTGSETLSTTPTENPFNDPYFSRQWYLENSGERIAGMDNFYRKAGELYFPEGTENRKEKIEKVIEILTNNTENVDIDYLKAKKFYDTARNRLSETQKQKKIVVAVIDDGVNYNLPELEWKMWNGENCRSWNDKELGNCIHGYNIANDEKDGINKDNSTHGTNIASLIAAKSNNNEGMVGIAPDVEIMAVNIEQNDGKITTLDVVKWIDFATVNGADIINLSIGSVHPVNLENMHTFDFMQYVSMLKFPGLIINAAGNEGTNLDNNSSVVFPAVFVRSFVVNDIRYDALSNLVTVGSIQQNGTKSWFSNYGINTVEIMAPGWNILMAGRQREWANTDLENTDYDMSSGTSFAAPITLASLAFAKSAYPERSWDEIRNIMYETVTRGLEYETQVKYIGRLNLGNMMERLESEYQPPEPLTAEIISSNTHWTNQDITLILRSNKDIFTPTGWEKINNRAFQKNISSNQNLTINIRTEEESTTIFHAVEKIDKTKPTIKINNQNNATITKPWFSLQFSGNDSESGIKNFECKTGSSSWSLCQSPVKINLQNEWKHYIFVRATDNAGNISQESTLTIIYKNPDTQSNTSEPIVPRQNNSNTQPSQSHRGGGGGGYVPTISHTPSIQPTLVPKISTTHTTSEENITLSSAPEKNFSSKNSYSIEEIQAKLNKNWIQETENGPLVRFSIAKKIHWLKKIFNEHTANSSSSEWENSVIEIYGTLMKHWKQWKFFILNL